MRRLFFCLLLFSLLLISCDIQNESILNEEAREKTVFFYDSSSYKVGKTDKNKFNFYFNELNWTTESPEISIGTQKYVFVSEGTICRYYQNARIMFDIINNVYASVPEELANKIDELINAESDISNLTKVVFCYDKFNKEVHLLDDEKSKKLLSIFQNGTWEQSITKTIYSHLLITENGLYRYCPESNIVNDPTNDRHLKLTEEQTETINAYLEK